MNKVMVNLDRRNSRLDPNSVMQMTNLRILAEQAAADAKDKDKTLSSPDLQN